MSLHSLTSKDIWERYEFSSFLLLRTDWIQAKINSEFKSYDYGFNCLSSFNWSTVIGTVTHLKTWSMWVDSFNRNGNALGLDFDLESTFGTNSSVFLGFVRILKFLILEVQIYNAQMVIVRMNFALLDTWLPKVSRQFRVELARCNGKFYAKSYFSLVKVFLFHAFHSTLILHV